MKKNHAYSRWEKFDTEEYANRCYGKIMNVDRLLIEGAIRAIQKLKLKPGSLRRVADIGTGPNLFPALLLSPFVAPKTLGGQLDLIEYSSPNRTYLKSFVNGKDKTTPLGGMWNKYQDIMASHGRIWANTLQETREKACVIAGSVYDLEQDVYDAISSYFVSESITDSYEECERGINFLLGAVKPGGFVMIAHMIESSRWYAGEANFFPAVPLTIKDLYTFYEDKLDFLTITQPEFFPEVRSDFHGAALVTGIKKQQISSN